MRGDILRLKRRDRWCEAEKLESVLSVGVGGATVPQVAQRHDVTRQAIYAWRHKLKKKGLHTALPEALFLPVEVERTLELMGLAADPHAEAARPAQVELQPANGRFLRFDPVLIAITLTQVIRAVEMA